MTRFSDGFEGVADSFDEALMLVSPTGEIRGVNAAARYRLFAAGHFNPGQSLTELVTEPVERVLDYLKLCSRSTQSLPGTLTFGAHGSDRPYHARGSATRLRSASRRIVLLRLSPKEESVQRFAALNVQIEQLRREIAKRISAEKAAADGQELLRVTLGSIGDAVITTDRQGLITFLNPVAETITGWEHNEARGKHLDEIFVIRNEKTKKPVEGPVAKVLREGAVVGLANHTMLIPRTGEPLPIDDSGAPIKSSSGELLGVVLVFHEISERRRLERELERQAEALREADRRKNEFLAMLSHELRNPLAPIENAVAILRLKGATEHFDRLLGMVDRQVTHLARLVDDLLDISRISRGVVSLQKTLVPLGAVLEHAIEMSRLRIEQRAHRLSVTLPPPTVIVDGDADRLAQVFSNLLNNAAKYMEPGGEIELAAIEENGSVTVTVVDQGRGMDPEFLQVAFEPFTRERSTADTEGLGVGLTLVKTIVQLHGGEVRAFSKGRGHGSQFVVRLPTR